MRLTAGGFVAAALLAVHAFAAGPAALADAGPISFAPCSGSNDFACGHLTVPVDPGAGAAGGVITLAVRRHRAPVGDEKTAVIALAGGPGQAALPFTEQFMSLLGPIVATRDLIVFDQRGTGLSHRLSCRHLEGAGETGPSGPAVALCAAQIGPTRTFYTTADSVADIEAIRRAGGYEKLVLYGTSYGTKLAEQYAQSYPGNVEALVLDSVVPPNGPDPLNRATFAAVSRVLAQLCAARACAHVTRNPSADLANLIARIARKRLYGRWVDGHGRSHRIAISADDVLEILLDGDLDPTLRAEFPGAVRAASHGDAAELARLLVRAEAGTAESEPEGPPEGFDTPLYYATSCEEEPFGWNRGSDPRTRLAEAIAQIRALPAGTFFPFERSDLLGISDIPACAFWPYTTPPPPPEDAPLPAVPTLILSGADDLRTPTANAREVAAQIPGSHLLVVPSVGHSVLGAELGDCASNALQALFAAKQIKPCPATPLPPLLRPTPLPPARLADVPPAPGERGRPGRTLTAVLLTLADFDRQLAYQALAALASGQLESLGSLSVGGLRAGWAGISGRQLVLHHYSYIPGITVSGELGEHEVALRVGGPAAAAGTLYLSGRGSLNGVLGEEAVQVSAAGTPGAQSARRLSAILRRGGRSMAALRASTEAERLRWVGL